MQRKSKQLNHLLPKVPAVFTAVVAPEFGLLQLRAAEVRCVLRVQLTRIPVAQCPHQEELRIRIFFKSAGSISFYLPDLATLKAQNIL